MAHLTPEDQELLRNNVQAGIKLLDEKRPGWRDSVSIPRIDLALNSDCVLGQLYRSYKIGIHKLGLDHFNDYGFNYPHSIDMKSDDGYGTYRQAAERYLTKQWKEQLTVAAEAV